MVDLPITAKQLGIILFWGGFAWWCFRWAWRNTKAQAGIEERKDEEPEER